MTLKECIKTLNSYAKSARNIAKDCINKDGRRKLIKTAERYEQEAKWLEELSRARTLLKATHELLETADESPYVLDALSIVVNYDDAECDGCCLKEDIEYYFDEYGEDGDAE